MGVEQPDWRVAPMNKPVLRNNTHMGKMQV